MSHSVTQFEKPLDKSKYVIDEKNKTFSTKEDYLVLDFTGLDDWTFKTGSHCSFNTGKCCIFNTFWNCTFKTGDKCIFNTGSRCNFKTGYMCTFVVGSNCTFHTLWDCAFLTGSICTFETEHGCTFNTGSCCTFKTRNNCIFNTSYDCEFFVSFSCTFHIHGGFDKIKTGGNSTVLIRDKKIHTYLEEEVEIYFQDGIILYTENKFTKNKYLMMKELRK